MKAEILATGDEIRSGALVDSNSAYIAVRLEENGVEVMRHTSVGDHLPTLVSTLREIGRRTDVAVVTGGLGPTTDDLSAEAAAQAAGVELVLDEDALANVESFFRKFNRPMTASNRKQAMLPAGAARSCTIPWVRRPGFPWRSKRAGFSFCRACPMR
jgi:nicotinamide-nucleotide amidase